MIALAADALALAAAYALVALGFVLVVKATGVVNFAQGDLVAAGGVLAALAGDAVRLPGMAVLILVAIAMAAVGLALAAIAWLPVRRRPAEAAFITTIAFGLILREALTLLAGPEPRAVAPLIAGGPVAILGTAVPRQDLAIILVAGAVMLAQAWLFTRTQLGRRLRAVAADPEMARACGIPATAMVVLSFVLATALAGIGGVLIANRTFVAPGGGTGLILRAYIATALGGWGSLPGAVVGAAIVALFETLVATFVSYPAATAGLYLLVLAVLAVRPRGLFGEAAGRRA